MNVEEQRNQQREVYYTSREEVLDTLNQRRSDSSLQRRINEFIQDEIGFENPCEFQGAGILARHLPVCRKETLYSKALCDELGVDFAMPSFSNDRYVNCSAEKRSFLKFNTHDGQRVELVSGQGRNNYDISRATLRDLVCENSRTPVIDYHFFRTNSVIGDFGYFDFDPQGLVASEYYPAYLAMFGGTNCLLEDFHGGESGAALKKFTQGIFEPAFRRVQSELGFKPLVTPIPFESDFSQYVFCPNSAQECINTYRGRIRNNEL